MIRSYKSAFLLVFTALMVLTVASVATNAYRRASEISVSLSGDIINEMSEKIVGKTLRIFKAAQGYLETNAVLFSGPGAAPTRDQAFQLFWRQLQLEPQLVSIYLADPRGSFLQVRERPQLLTRFIERDADGTVEQLVYRNRDYEPIAHVDGGGLYDPRERPWFEGAVSVRGSVYWSPVYRFAATGEPGVTAAKAIFGGDESLHVIVAVDITLDSLSDFLAEQRGTRDALALIVDRHGNLVAYPHQLTLSPRKSSEDSAMLHSVDDLEEIWLRDAYHALSTSQM